MAAAIQGRTDFPRAGVDHMRRLLGIGLTAWLVCAGSAVYAQPLTPLGDPVQTPLLPSGVSESPFALNAELVYLFKEGDGTDVQHFVGDFALTTDITDGLTLRAREAVVWMRNLQFEGRPYRRLEMLLWRDAEIVEVGGTVTSGPALFVTLSTFGDVTINVDDVAYQPTLDSRAYREGGLIRQSAAEGRALGSDASVHLRIFDASGLTSPDKPPSPRPMIQVRSEGELSLSDLGADGQVLTVTGGVYLSRGIPGSGEALEISADSVVVFMPPARPTGQSAEPSGAGLGGQAPPRGGGGQADEKAPGRGDNRDRQILSTGFGDLAVESAYLEGDVILRQGANVIRAERLYYGFLEDRALILDAVIRTSVARRNLPLYIRAAEIRQLSRRHFTASNAILTTSEFHTPHYHVGAGKVELLDRTPSTVKGQLRAGTFSIRHATLNVLGHPIAYWPFIRGDIDTSETSIESIRTGFSDDFGAELETKWHFFNVLDLETPRGFDATLTLDFFSERGPAAGVEAKYTRDTYFGVLRSYLMTDSDEDFLGRDREVQSRRDVRGRFLLRHRQYLEDGWQMSLEMSYISDRGFLEEFFESEFDNDKEQETLLYLKRQRENFAFTGLFQARLLDFTTQVERLPDFGLFVVGEPIWPNATWYSEYRAGVVRFRPGDQTFRELLRDGRMQGSGAVVRADSRQEFTAPFDLGPWRIVPFSSIRGTVWDDSRAHGGVGRVFATYGVSGSMYLSKVFPEARSALFDIDGLRHLIKPTFVVWMSHTNRDPSELFVFDPAVEAIEEIDGAALGVRQRWQTKRGADDNRRTVDLLTWDAEIGVFNDTDPGAITNGFVSLTRPELSIARNYVSSSLIWRVNDRTAFLSELNYDLNDGEVDIFNVSLAVERPPRLSYLVGYRLIEESKSELLGVDFNYRLNEKHTLALREQFDLHEGRTLDFTVALIRRFPRWFGAISFALDEAEDDFGVSLSIWPEGLPQAALGSKRFTGLATTTRLRGQ